MSVRLCFRQLGGEATQAEEILTKPEQGGMPIRGTNEHIINSDF